MSTDDTRVNLFRVDATVNGRRSDEYLKWAPTADGARLDFARSHRRVGASVVVHAATPAAHERKTGTARVLGSDAARAVGRFRADGPIGYRAATAPDAPLRATREDAEGDERRYLEGGAA